MWLLVMYSNYFEIVSTVTFLDSRTELISGIFLFKTSTVSLAIYLYTISHTVDPWLSNHLCTFQFSKLFG